MPLSVGATATRSQGSGTDRTTEDRYRAPARVAVYVITWARQARRSGQPSSILWSAWQFVWIQ